MIDYLNPSSEKFLGTKIVELFKNLFESLFVPDEERLTAIPNTIKSKFGFIDTIKEAINALQNIFNNLGNAPKLESSNIESKYYNGKLTIIDMSWYEPFKPYGDVVLTGFIYLMFLWRLFVHAPSIIHGANGMSVFDNSHDDWGND